ncbi:4Fe-4S dicluster domain-containing protein [bacterium]|nr:4Fe-4S dicluster domain-containing protein [candidate division CSSED10-310 bacterium]
MNELHSIARELLESGKVNIIVGWEASGGEKRTRPVIIREADQVERLVFNHYCLNNLAVYLNRTEVRDAGVVGILAKGCDARAIVQMIQENRLERHNIHVIGFNCNGVTSDFNLDFQPENIAPKCIDCPVRTPPIYDSLLGELQSMPEMHNPLLERIQEVRNQPAPERFSYWREEFSKCIRCYACRQVCPLCYCTQCIADKTVPRWIESSAHDRGNFSWNLIRAFHLAGRCIGCGECERACPVDIPLSLLNRRLADVVAQQFSYRPGMDPEDSPWLGSFTMDDCEEFIK